MRKPAQPPCAYPPTQRRSWPHTSRTDATKAPATTRRCSPTPDALPANGVLRPAIVRTAARLPAQMPWMHGSHCRYGADIDITQRRYGWLIERGLSIHLLDDALMPYLNYRARPQTARPQ
jgi:hypothetical protein